MDRFLRKIDGSNPLILFNNGKKHFKERKFLSTLLEKKEHTHLTSKAWNKILQVNFDVLR